MAAIWKPITCMNDTCSSTTKAWLAAMESLPILAISVVKSEKVIMSRNHMPPIGPPVRTKRRITSRRGRTGAVA